MECQNPIVFKPAVAASGATLIQEPTKSMQEEQRTQDSSGNSVAIQANDYDIEREQSILPARQRIIPFKFRDYCDPDAIKKEDDPDDEEYLPAIRAPRDPKPSGKPRGRPRKLAKDHTYQSSATTNAGDSMEENELSGKAGSKSSASSLLHDVSALMSGKFKCDAEGCHHVFQNSKTLRKHQITMHTENTKGRVGRLPKGEEDTLVRQFKCNQCDKSFTSKGNLKVHMLIHEGSRPFKCDAEGCDKTFRYIAAFKSHRLAHLGIKPYSCEVCGKKVSSNNALKEHMSLHTDTRPYECEHCHKTFRQLSCYKRHVPTHTSSKPYSCNVCGKRFSLMSYVRSHMKSHSGERPYECEECGKRFARQSDINRHKIIHSGEKPYACLVCGARFSDSSSCRRHSREHESYKPYKCQMCNEAFKRVTHLQAHVSKKHSVQNEQANPEEDVPLGEASQKRQAEAAPPHELPPDVQQEIIEQIQRQIGSGEGVSPDGQPVQVAYHIIHDDENQQVVEIQYMRPPQGEELTLQREELTSQGEDLKLQGEELTGDGAALTSDGIEGVEGQVTMIQMPGLAQDVVNMTEVPLNTEGVVAVQNFPDTSQNTGHAQIMSLEHVNGTVLQIQALNPESEEAVAMATENLESENPIPDDQQEILSQEEDEKEANVTMLIESEKDFVNNPDFNCQDYYNWLASFTDWAKLLPVPLDLELFQKISQVHKSLTDVMANPQGVLSDRQNFVTLMALSNDLSAVINSHLSHVLGSLSSSK